MTPKTKQKQDRVQPWEAATADSPPINLEARFQNGDSCFLAKHTVVAIQQAESIEQDSECHASIDKIEVVDTDD